MGLEKIRDWIDARYVGLDINVLPCSHPLPPPTQAMRKYCRFPIGCWTLGAWCDPVMCCTSFTGGSCLIQGDVLPGFTDTHTLYIVYYLLEVVMGQQSMTKHYLTCEYDYYVM